MGLSIITTPQELWKFGTHERGARGTPLMLQAVTLGDVAALRYTTLRRSGVSTGYAVSAGKKLIITRALFRADAPNASMSLGYVPTDQGIGNNADGEDPVELDSSAGNGLGVLVALVANTIYDVPVYYEIAATMYPRVVLPVGVVNLYSQFFGHEV